MIRVRFGDEEGWIVGVFHNGITMCIAVAKEDGSIVQVEAYKVKVVK